MRFLEVTEEGHSVLAHIHGFEPYFYVECPKARDLSRTYIYIYIHIL